MFILFGIEFFFLLFFSFFLPLLLVLVCPPRSWPFLLSYVIVEAFTVESLVFFVAGEKVDPKVWSDIFDTCSPALVVRHASSSLLAKEPSSICPMPPYGNLVGVELFRPRG